MRKDYLSAKAAFAWGNTFLTGEYAEFRNSYTDPTGEQLPVAEYEWTTAVAPNFEKSIRRRYFLGRLLSNKDIIGISADYRDFEFSEQYYKFQALIYQMNLESIRVTFGAGGQESSETGAGGVVVFRVSHIIAPSLPKF